MTEEKTTNVDSNGLVVVGEEEKLELYEKEREEIIDLKNQAEGKYWEFSAKLTEIFNKVMYINWGHATWNDYVTQELDFGLTKARNLIKIHKWLEGMPENIRDFFHKLGWTKAKLFVQIVNPDNFEKWKAMIEGKTVVELEAMLKEDEPSDDALLGDGSENGDGETRGRETEHREKFSFNCVGNQIPIVKGAIDRAMEIAGTDNKNHAFSMICAEFQSANSTNVTVNDYIKTVEAYLGVKLIAIKKHKDKEDEIIYGEEYMVDDTDESSEESDDTSEE